MISRKSKYAIRAALFLARNHGKSPVSVEKIASAEKISKKFLEAIMLDLKLGGLLDSQRGKHGGYVLHDSPDQITLGRIIRTIDGPLAPVRCVSVTAYKACEDCLDEATCPIRLVMKEVRESISRVLDLKTLAEVIHSCEALPVLEDPVPANPSGSEISAPSAASATARPAVPPRPRP